MTKLDSLIIKERFQQKLDDEVSYKSQSKEVEKASRLAYRAEDSAVSIKVYTEKMKQAIQEYEKTPTDLNYREVMHFFSTIVGHIKRLQDASK